MRTMGVWCSLMLVIVLLCSCGADRRSRETPRGAGVVQAPETQEQSVSRALSILEDTPDWSGSMQMDPADKARIMRSMEELSRFDTDTLRTAAERHLNAPPKHSFVEVPAWGRVYLLNRYIFNVPSIAPPRTPSFGGWFSAERPQNCLLWPLALGEEGKLELIATGSHYKGPSYLGLREFDYFRQKFGRRAER